VPKKSAEIIGVEACVERKVALAVQIANEYGGDLEAETESRRNRRSGFVEKAYEAATDDTASGEGHAYRSQRFCL
jgi:hypothetical protein